MLLDSQTTVTLLLFMQGSADVDSLGNPYGFTPTPLPHHHPSFPVLVTTQMSRPRSVNQLILISDEHYLAAQQLA